jgi:hypothetical protein
MIAAKSVICAEIDLSIFKIVGLIRRRLKRPVIGFGCSGVTGDGIGQHNEC